MLLPESIAIFGLSISFVSAMITVAGFMYRMTKDVAEIKKQVMNDIQHIAEQEDEKRAGVYARLDKVKEEMNQKFVIKDICNVLHTQLGKDIVEMKTDVKLLLKMNGQEK